MRLLNDEELMKLFKEYESRGTPEFMDVLRGRFIPHELVANAQHQLDLREFIEWLEQWDEGRSAARIVPSSAIESLKQLVE